MAGSWSGAAGAAAGAETTSLATITGDKGGRVGAGATAFTDYGTALESAIAQVRTIRRQADDAEVDARSEAARTGQGLPSDVRQEIYHSIRGQLLAPLRAHYRGVIETLDRAAGAAAAALTGAVPEYRSGMKPADIALAVRDSVAARLPSVLQLDGQTRARELAAQLQPLLEHGKQIPADLLDQLEADKDNPWFATTLLEALGPQAPNWAMLVMEGNGFPTDYNQRVITDFGQLLALSTRQTGDARLSDSYVQEFLAPLDEHNGIGLQYAWHLGNLLHFGGTFGTGFLQQAGDKLYALDKEGADSQMYTMVGGWMNRPLTDDLVPDDSMEAYFDGGREGRGRGPGVLRRPRRPADVLPRRPRHGRLPRRRRGGAGEGAAGGDLGARRRLPRAGLGPGHQRPGRAARLAEARLPHRSRPFGRAAARGGHPQRLQGGRVLLALPHRLRRRRDDRRPARPARARHQGLGCGVQRGRPGGHAGPARPRLRGVQVGGGGAAVGLGRVPAGQAGRGPAGREPPRRPAPVVRAGSRPRCSSSCSTPTSTPRQRWGS